jgi:2'-5' RNA ligase
MSGYNSDPSFYIVSGYGADQGFTEDEAYALLAGLDDTSSTAVMPMVAAADADEEEEHTGAMVALVPSDEDIARLVVEGGEAADELHLTLMFLGEAADISENARAQIIAAVERYAETPMTANGFSVNVFNPMASNSCIVLGVGNDDGALQELQMNIASSLGGLSGVTFPPQHTPWVPHVTLAYTDEFDNVEELGTRTGPITFDKLRVAFGGDVHDIPLGVAMTASAEEFAERDVNAPGGGHDLRKYWVHGPGAVKIAWGTDGSFARCVSHLGKYVRDPQGLCAEYHKAATGEWPAEKGVESAGDMETFHGHHNQEDHGNWADIPNADKAKLTDRLKTFRRMIDRDVDLSAAEEDEFHTLVKAEQSGRLKYDPMEGALNAEKRRLGDKLKSHKKNWLQKLLPDNRDPGVPMSSIVLTAAQAVKQAEDEPWEGVLTVEGEESGDGRLFGHGSLDWAELPMPLMYQPASVGGHDASVLAGAITFAARKGSQIFGRGHVFGNMLDSEHGDGIRNMMSTGGVSVDVDKVKDADVEMVFAEGEAGLMAKPELTVFHRGRIRGATLVAFPAFVEAKLGFTNESMLTAAGESCGCSGGGDSYVLTAASHTITIPDVPPAEWFSEPVDVQAKGALTITDEGRVFGWLAPAAVTHRSVRKTVPMGANVDYSRFMKGETIVAGGGRVVSGVITGNCGHADTENYGTLANRKKHYDDSCSVFANIAVGQRPGKGVWVAGALRHGVTAEQVATAMGCSLSGDWQPHPDRPGVQEFIAALLVPVPGFAMARTQASITTASASVLYQDGVLTAAAIPIQFGEAIPRTEVEMAQDIIAEYKDLLLASLDLDPQSRKDAVMADLEME